ncbi:MAG: hypothetical protein PVH19_08990, partial [Planctomycetia bacterium]
MDDWRIKFRVGFTVFVIGFIAAILILLLGDTPAFFQKKWPVEIHLEDAPSVAKGTPIRKSGVLIGQVTEVTLLPEGGVVLKAEIDDGVKINANEVCQVQSSLFGDTNLRIARPAGQKLSQKWLEPGGEIQGQTAPDPFMAVSETSEQLHQLISHIDKMLNSNRSEIDQIITQTSNILTSVEKTTQLTDKVLNSQQINNDKFPEDLAREISMLPGMFANAREAVAKLGEAMDKMNSTMDKMNSTMTLVDDNLKNIKDVTEPLGQNAPRMVQNMNNAIENLDEVLGQFEKFSRTINENQGTLGKLVHDDELYQRLNQAACNIQEVSSRLRPIV